MPVVADLEPKEWHEGMHCLPPDTTTYTDDWSPKHHAELKAKLQTLGYEVDEHLEAAQKPRIRSLALEFGLPTEPVPVPPPVAGRGGVETMWAVEAQAAEVSAQAAVALAAEAKAKVALALAVKAKAEARVAMEEMMEARKLSNAEVGKRWDDMRRQAEAETGKKWTEVKSGVLAERLRKGDCQMSDAEAQANEKDIQASKRWAKAQAEAEARQLEAERWIAEAMRAREATPIQSPMSVVQPTTKGFLHKEAVLEKSLTAPAVVNTVPEAAPTKKKGGRLRAIEDGALPKRFHELYLPVWECQQRGMKSHAVIARHLTQNDDDEYSAVEISAENVRTASRWLQDNADYMRHKYGKNSKPSKRTPRTT